MELEKLKFPVGKFVKPTVITKELLQEAIATIANFPKKIKEAVANLNNTQLDTPYRPQGWTIRQVVHHCADSHLNSFTRFKLALTEENPTIKPYREELWAELPDGKMPIEPSLLILEGVHQRWTVLLQSLSESDLKRSFIHPEHQKSLPLDEVIFLYSWHCNHHLAHITVLKEQKGW